ncbi:MAG: dihydrodipicolinate synthase family protein [Propionicimonas sp.]|nr:dihydrodipicolinate synthase family protein [Propionicimonas sp.]
MIGRTKPQVLAAVPTAFSPHGDVSVDGTKALTEFLAEAGVDGLFLCGTAGEFPALSPSDRGTVARAVMDTVGTDVRVVLHAGAASIREVAQLLEIAGESGITDVAIITPYFLPNASETLLGFYREVSALSQGLHTYLYVYRALCGSYVDPAGMAAIAELPNIVGAKISGETPATIGEFIDRTPPEFEVYAGADQELVAMAEQGAIGVVSAMASARPRPFVALADAWASNDADAVARWQAAVDDVCGVLGGQIPRTRYALSLQQISVGRARMSLDGVEGAENEIARIVNLYR